MFYFKDKNQITVFFADGSTAIWSMTNPAYNQVAEWCKNNNWLEIECLYKQNKMIMSEEVQINEDGSSTITKDGKSITLQPESSTLASFIKLLHDKGEVDTTINRIKPFLKNMFENPFINAVTELYDYCKAMDFEITDDGCFLAYKNVNWDLGSIHDNGQTKHVIGQYTTVEAFDTDRHQVCSKGLHFCSKDYLSTYKGPITIVVKVNPKDVVAIPVDYHYQKGRCRRYLTVGILKEDDTLSTVFDRAKAAKKMEEEKAEAKRRMKEHCLPIGVIRVHQLKEAGLTNIQIANKLGISFSKVRKNIKRYNKAMKE